MTKICASFLLCSLLLLASSPLSADRKPLPRPILKKIEHDPTGTRLRSNPETGETEEYQVNGKIIYDEQTGKFLLRWSGRDGQKKTVLYEPHTGLDGVIAAAVDYDTQENAYRYSYVLSNLPSSKQKLHSFYLEANTSMREVKAPELWTPARPNWYSRPFTKYLQEQFEVKGGWVWSDVLLGRMGLSPGQTVGGFSYLSPGLPSVVKCYVDAYTRLKGGGGEELPEELHAAIARVGWKFPHGVTVGPVTPPEPIYPPAFARKIVEMLDVSVEQGWVESPHVARELRGLLENAAQALEGGERGKASVILRKLLDRVEQEKERALLSEAYALLKFNLEFLQEQLGSH